MTSCDSLCSPVQYVYIYIYICLQTCQTPIRPITANSLLDSVCWSISEPTSSAAIYTESSSIEDANEQTMSMFFDARADGKDSEVSFVNLSRPLTERLKNYFSLLSSNNIY